MKKKFKTTAIVASLVMAMLSTSIDVSAKVGVYRIIKKVVTQPPVKIKVSPIVKVRIPSARPLPNPKTFTPIVLEKPNLQSEYLKAVAVKCLANTALDSTLFNPALNGSLNVAIPSETKRCSMGQRYLTGSPMQLNELFPENFIVKELYPNPVFDMHSAEKQVLEMHDKIFNVVIKEEDFENK